MEESEGEEGMTKEEVTEVNKILDYAKAVNRVAYKVLKEALEQEPCEDAISRVETVQFLASHSNDFEDVKIRMAFQAASSLVNNPHNLPSVQLKPKTKTGRHFPQIIEVLKQIKGEADGK